MDFRVIDDNFSFLILQGFIGFGSFAGGTLRLALPAIVLGFLLGTLIATGILALSLVMPGWAAALIVSGVLLLIIAILVGIALANFRRGSEPLESIESVRQDIDAITGRGAYGSRD